MNYSWIKKAGIAQNIKKTLHLLSCVHRSPPPHPGDSYMFYFILSNNPDMPILFCSDLRARPRCQPLTPLVVLPLHSIKKYLLVLSVLTLVIPVRPHSLASKAHHNKCILKLHYVRFPPSATSSGLSCSYGVCSCTISPRVYRETINVPVNSLSFLTE